MPVLSALYVYPVKSCAGISLREATITTAGLMTEHIYDREWMVVDEQGEFLTQREHPRMALITPRLTSESMLLRAPGMLGLEIPLDLPDPESAPARMVRVWNDEVKAYDCDDIAATWFSSFLGVPCRLVRFHYEAQRRADSAWTGDRDAPTLFSDGFPLLVLSRESLGDLNEKLKGAGRTPVSIERFRPNIVIGGGSPFDEDHIRTLTAGAAVIEPVKPCARCSIPSVDPATGERGPDPLDILGTYRANPILNGAVSLGMNAVLAMGDGEVLRVGQELKLDLAF